MAKSKKRGGDKAHAKKVAARNQKISAEKTAMQNLFNKKMQEQMASGEKEQMEEDVEMLRQILDNLLAYSFSQEDVMKQFKNLKRGAPSFNKNLKIQQDLKDLVYKVNGAAIEVHKSLGPGLLESVYHKCLIRELELRNVKFQSELSIPIQYKGIEVDAELRCDLLIEDKLVLELKFLMPFHSTTAGKSQGKV